jgi:hypothetical protein
MATRRSSKPVVPDGAYVAAGDVWHDKHGERLDKPTSATPFIARDEIANAIMLPLDPRRAERDGWREVAKRVRPEWTDEQFNDAWDSFIEFRRQMCC